jgi:urocanate hydratase
VLRDFINATVGFAALTEAKGTPPKSLMRMSGSGVMRNADAGYEEAIACAKEHGLKLPGITM